MKDLILYIVNSIVEFPDKVSVTEVEGEKGKVLELRVAETDLGKVIGKQGRTAKAMRSILAAAGMKAGNRYSLEIIEQ